MWSEEIRHEAIDPPLPQGLAYVMVTATHARLCVENEVQLLA